MTDMKVKAVAPWFGGKRTMAPEIVAELGPHGQYFEPFCGSAAVLFAKEQSQKETISDLHRDVINLLWCVADPEKAVVLYDHLQRAPFSEELLAEAVGRLEAEPSVPDDLLSDEPTAASISRAYWYFLSSWCGRNGTAGTIRRDYQLAVRWTTSGGSPTVRFRNAVDSMPAWHRRLLNVVIMRRDAFRWLPRVEDSPKSAIYLDPPYVIDGTTRSGCSSSGDNGRYVHDFAGSGNRNSGGLFGTEPSTCQHEQLRDIVREFKKARIVISYYDCPLIRSLYDGWTFVEKTRQKHLHNQAGRGHRPKEAPEVLIINGQSYGEHL